MSQFYNKYLLLLFVIKGKTKVCPFYNQQLPLLEEQQKAMCSEKLHNSPLSKNNAHEKKSYGTGVYEDLQLHRLNSIHA